MIKIQLSDPDWVIAEEIFMIEVLNTSFRLYALKLRKNFISSILDKIIYHKLYKPL
jgi:hypothetical protein